MKAFVGCTANALTVLFGPVPKRLKPSVLPPSSPVVAKPVATPAPEAPKPVSIAVPKPVVAMVNGFAVGGGNVLQMVCDITIAKESAIFRQVGPMMGSFDAGYGTWYLEDLVGKKKAKEMWFANPRLSAKEALDIGLINKVVPDDKLKEETRKMALEIADRGAFARRTGKDRKRWPRLQSPSTVV